jgi:hypothetical protein
MQDQGDALACGGEENKKGRKTGWFVVLYLVSASKNTGYPLLLNTKF